MFVVPTFRTPRNVGHPIFLISPDLAPLTSEHQFLIYPDLATRQLATSKASDEECPTTLGDVPGDDTGTGRSRKVPLSPVFSRRVRDDKLG